MQLLLLDLRLALRSLVRTPAFSIIAVVTLALGIGANSAIFSLVNAVLLRPLPYAAPEQLIAITESANGSTDRKVSGHEYAAWRDDNRTLQGVLAYEGAGLNLTGSGEARSVSALAVSANYFTVLGIQSAVGRVFQNGDDRAGANRIVILSDALWKNRFAGDSNVVGRSIQLNDESYVVVGVMEPRAFDPQLWVPMNTAEVEQKIGKHSLTVIGRLKNGATLEQASQDLNRISGTLEKRMPDQNTGHAAVAVDLHESVVGNSRQSVLIAFGAVAFVLLIACANVAHLLLTRATNRQREIALRTALGAGRGRLISHLMSESLILAAAGGVGGMLLAMWIVQLVPQFSGTNIPRLNETSVDGRVLAATAAFVVIAALVSGVLPAIRGTLPRLGELLNSGARSSSGNARRLAGFLVVSEISLALVLLIGAGLTVRSLTNLEDVNPGFDASSTLVVGLSLPSTRYADPTQQRNAFDQITAGIRDIPGVQSVGGTTQFPLSGENDWLPADVEGAPPLSAGEENNVAWRVVTSDYFAAMHIPFLQGRAFQSTDARVSLPLIRWYKQQPLPARFDEPQSSPVAVVSKTMAERNWPGQNPIGKRFRLLESPYITVVGVVDDVKHRALNLAPSAEVYLTGAQEPQSWTTLAIRTGGDPLSFVPSVRAAIRAIDKDLPAERIRTLEDVRSQSVGDARLNATLFGAFGALALVMAVVGIYGVISYSVSQRTQEIGIRAAIGASSRDVIQLVLGRAVWLTSVGICVGVAGALALSRVLERLLFGVTAADPATLLMMSLGLGAVAILASYIPARRALKVSPIEALRGE
ncbi:MAG: ABC transporter permease [Gemmatimonas sp.]